MSVSQMLVKAKSLAKSGDLGQAENLYREVLEKFPSNKRAKEGLLTLKASASGQKEPTKAQIQALVELMNRQRFPKLLDRLKAMISQFPKAAVLRNIQGAVHLAMQKNEAAVNSLKRAVALDQNFAEAHNNLGNAYHGLGRYADAVTCFQRALRIKPRFAEAYFNRGTSLNHDGKPEQAIASFKKAAEIQPNNLNAHDSICNFYERNNDIDAYEKAVGVAVEQFGERNPIILAHVAQLAVRKNQHSDAIAHLNNMPTERLHPLKQEVHFNALAKSYDKLGQYQNAFSAFQRQNAIGQKLVEASGVDPESYYTSITSRITAWGSDAGANWAPSANLDDRRDPTFLVGFPRSGTTLLDTIMRSHNDISVIEEQPMLAEMEKVFSRPETIENLFDLTDAEISELRKTYFEALDIRDTSGGNANIVVDKFPMHLIHAGLINRVFPRAKFILVLRHPCDCVLSCFMQNFNNSAAMANFLSLEQTAKMYAAVFELWSLFQQKLNLDIHVIKYEDLIEGLEETCKPLIEFLDLEWDDNLLNYRETALKGDTIKTPSYTQVVQPLYNQANGRWVNYRDRLDPLLPELQPWIDEFGYSA